VCSSDLLNRKSGTEPLTVPVQHAVIAGWTGRDTAKMQAHIDELAELGVAPPSATPLFYRISTSRLTMADSIDLPGDNSSGEVEWVLVQHGGELFVGVGSDHTDRTVEAYSVAVSKQVSDKPIAATLWPFAEIADHWDQLIIRSHVNDGAGDTLYQEGPVTAMLAPADLIAKATEGGTQLANGTVLFGGTLTAIGGVRPSAHFSFSLEDPVLGRTLSHSYDVVNLPLVS